MCSVIKWSDNGAATIVARNMDWQENLYSNLWLFPRGMSREGLAGQNSLSWNSKYGSVITSALDMISTDGMNEKSLACHMLQLTGSDYGKRDETIPGLSLSLWLQFFLDNFARVDEAVDFVQDRPFQLLPCIAGNTVKISDLHMMIEDISGDAAVFEYTEGGRSSIYHNKELNIMTNSPTFDMQLENLKGYQGFGGNRPPPLTPESTNGDDRFVRAAFYQKSLPNGITTAQEVLAGVLNVARNVSQPLHTADPLARNVYPTQWRTASDLTNKVYYFESIASQNLIWVHLDKLDFSNGAPAKKIDLVNGPERLGDVSSDFREALEFHWASPITTET